jgi:hypothetical protein
MTTVLEVMSTEQTAPVLSKTQGVVGATEAISDANSAPDRTDRSSATVEQQRTAILQEQRIHMQSQHQTQQQQQYQQQQHFSQLPNLGDGHEQFAFSTPPPTPTKSAPHTSFFSTPTGANVLHGAAPRTLFGGSAFQNSPLAHSSSSQYAAHQQQHHFVGGSAQQQQQQQQHSQVPAYYHSASSSNASQVHLAVSVF